ncbi:MAG: response regulator [Armatimonadetes bacterium]|nr:response regulator [Armatimonadota bacterium]
MAKILLVDDEPNIVKLTSLHLRRQGHAVISAENGAAALLSARDEEPDLIVLDVLMPVMDGFEALRALKADPKTRGIPVIMFTCRALDEDIAHGLSEGADLYMTKPFDMNGLVLAIGRILAARTFGEHPSAPANSD